MSFLFYGGGFFIKILALDQSTKITGFSLYEDEQLALFGTLESDPKEKNPIERMKQQYDQIKELIKGVKPNYVFIEQVHFKRNYGTFQQLSQLQGIIIAYLLESNIGFQNYRT